MIVIINNKSYDYKNAYKQVARDLLSRQSIHYQYQSRETIIENTNDLLGMISECLSYEHSITMERQDKSSISRLISRLNKFLETINETGKAKEKHHIVSRVFGLILALDGLGNLPEYGNKRKGGK